MKDIKLDSRLGAAMNYVRKGSVMADIGTDHGFIPIKLIEEGVSEFAYASDVNRQPLDKAVRNAVDHNVDGKMKFCLSDGLKFIDNGLMDDEHKITDIVICGMGGELIAEILAASGYIKQSTVRLVLQPMTMPDKLRNYLCSNGFEIEDETLCSAAEKIYTVMCVRYDGVIRRMTRSELLLGICNIKKQEPLFKEYAASFLRKLSTQIKGLESGGYSAESEKELYNEISALMEGKE